MWLNSLIRTFSYRREGKASERQDRSFRDDEARLHVCTLLLIQCTPYSIHTPVYYRITDFLHTTYSSQAHNTKMTVYLLSVSVGILHKMYPFTPHPALQYSVCIPYLTDILSYTYIFKWRCVGIDTGL